MSKCEICGKEIKKFGMGGHLKMAHSEEGKEITKKANAARKGKFHPAWNKGLTKDSDNRVMNNSKSLKGHVVTDTTKSKLSTIAKSRGLGGYNPKGGRGKKGWYKGYWCDSSWELAWIIYNLEHGRKFSKNTKKFSYIYKGKVKNYIPDFLIDDGTYVEVKGYFTEQVSEKVKQFPYSIEIFDFKKMKPIIEYVKEKYGNDFIKLYEENRSDGH